MGFLQLNHPVHQVEYQVNDREDNSRSTVDFVLKHPAAEIHGCDDIVHLIDEPVAG